MDAEIAFASLDRYEDVLGLAGLRGRVDVGPVASSSMPSGPTSTHHVVVDSPDSILAEPMEALDGDADVTFLMTTNRPDLLEKAMTRRAGQGRPCP